MRFRRVSKGRPEAVYAIVRNVSGSDAPIGGIAMWAGSVVSNAFGLDISYMDTNHYKLWDQAGIVVSNSILDGKYGLVQVFGHCDSVKVSGYGALDDFASLSTIFLTPSTAMYPWSYATSTWASVSANWTLYRGFMAHPVWPNVHGAAIGGAPSHGFTPCFLRGM